MKILYNCEQVADKYGVKVITVWDWIRKGRLPAMKIGKQYRITESDIKAFEAKARTQKNDL